MEAKVYFDLSCGTELPKGAGWKHSRKAAGCQPVQGADGRRGSVDSQEMLIWPLILEQSFP